MISLYIGLAIAIGVGLALVIDNGIANPIIAMQTDMRTLAGGDKTIKNDQMVEEQKVGQSTRNERAQRIEKPTSDFDSESSATLNSVDEVADDINKTAISMTAIA